MWMGRTNMIWMQLYIVNKVQLHLWLNDSLDCIPTSNFKAMQMFQGHKISFLRFHVNYRRSIKQKIFLNEKNMFLDQCLSNARYSCCTPDCKIFKICVRSEQRITTGYTSAFYAVEVVMGWTIGWGDSSDQKFIHVIFVACVLNSNINADLLYF